MSKQALSDFYDAYLEYLPLKNPKNVFKFTTKCGEELGEVCEAAAALQGNLKKTKKIASEGKTPEENMGEEIMDLVINCFNLVHAAKLDIETVFKNSTTKLYERVEEKKARKLAKKPSFPYKGNYDAGIDEYVPDCKTCYGEGWIVKRENIVACSCNPEGLAPRED